MGLQWREAQALELQVALGLTSHEMFDKLFLTHTFHGVSDAAACMLHPCFRPVKRKQHCISETARGNAQTEKQAQKMQGWAWGRCFPNSPLQQLHP